MSISRSNRHQYDVIVIGAGASGMMAAGRAAERGLKVLLLEKNKKVGKKLSVTGGDRCNILNFEEDTKKLLANYGEAAKFLYSPFSQHGMSDSKKFFESKGLPIVVEARQRAFPASQKAEDVTACLKRYATENNVELKCSTRVDNFIVEKGEIVGVSTNRGDYEARSYILATGGLAHKNTTSSGAGLDWVAKIGHTVHESSPNIVPLVVQEEWVKKLSGLTLSFMKITFGADYTKEAGRFSKTGKILFTHFGLSGPLILNSANEVRSLLKSGPILATIDLYPDTEVNVLRNRVLEVFDKNKNKELRNVLKDLVPAGMDKAVAEQFSPELQKMRVHSVSKEERFALVDRIKAMPMTITGTMGMDWAVISDGGIPLEEVDTKTMQSKKFSNLYLTGDVLHINRPSGGFSLQLCWTTGFVAGSHV